MFLTVLIIYNFRGTRFPTLFGWIRICNLLCEYDLLVLLAVHRSKGGNFCTSCLLYSFTNQFTNANFPIIFFIAGKHAEMQKMALCSPVFHRCPTICYNVQVGDAQLLRF